MRARPESVSVAQKDGHYEIWYPDSEGHHYPKAEDSFT
jgi:hypothetical protein